MNKVYTGKFYKVLRFKGHSYLSINRTEKLSEVIEDIKWITEDAKKRGFCNDEKWQIIRVEWTNVYDEDDVFCTRWEKETVVALYDNGEVTYMEEDVQR